ncbi:MAG: hypothetical protein HPY50_06015 [Firmicutes bacterium]|nr:hypothetical protein [Bacillota bacterium]
MGPLRVILINEVDGARRNLKNMLTRHGFIIVAEVKDAASGIMAILNTDAELIITEDATVGWQEVANCAQERQRAPVMLIVSQEDERIAEEAAKLGVLGLIVRPLTERNLAIMARFTALGSLFGLPRTPARVSEGLKAKSRRELLSDKGIRVILKKELP